MATTLVERKAALEEALGQGASDVRFPDGSSVSYRTVEDLQLALGFVNAEIARLAGVVSPSRVLRFATSKGFGAGGGGVW